MYVISLINGMSYKYYGFLLYQRTEPRYTGYMQMKLLKCLDIDPERQQ